MLKLNFNPFPQIETERLLLRRLTKGDLKSFYELRSNVEIMDKLDKEPASSLQEVMLLIEKIEFANESNTGIVWAICLKERGGVHIGNISFHCIYPEHHRAEIGYAIMPSFQRQGLVQEAMVAVLDFGFKTAGFHTIEAKINPVNTASRKLLEKNSFVKEAHFRESFYFRNKYLDTAIYSLINPYT